MPKFTYVVKDLEGKSYQNTLDAESRSELIRRLQAQKYFIVSIDEAAGAAGLAKPLPVALNRKFTHRGVRLVDKLVFARQMATMLGAGVTLSRTLQILLAQVESQKLYHVLRRVSRDVENGLSLSVALSQHPKVFDSFWVSLIEVGEASGTMPTVLNKLCLHLERAAEFRSTIISALIYPAILMTVAIGAIIFFALVVSPQFEQTFSKLNVKMPTLTKVLMGGFAFFREHMFVIFFLTASSIGSLVYFVCKTSAGKAMFERFILRIPFWGDVVRQMLVENFFSQMNLLIDAGVPILYALDISERLVDHAIFSTVVRDIKDGIKKGETIATPMSRTGFFPGMAIQMIVVGEETGQLSQMLGFVARYYQEIVSVQMKRFSTIIEPVMIIFMGATIGVIVIAMFMPLFSLSNVGTGGG